MLATYFSPFEKGDLNMLKFVGLVSTARTASWVQSVVIGKLYDLKKITFEYIINYNKLTYE